jgi:hypothetical protein
MAAIGAFVSAFYIGYVLSNAAFGVRDQPDWPAPSPSAQDLGAAQCAYTHVRVRAVLHRGRVYQGDHGAHVWCRLHGRAKFISAWFGKLQGGNAEAPTEST